MKNKKLKIIGMALVISLIFVAGIATGLILKELPKDTSLKPTNAEDSSQHEPVYHYDDVVLIVNNTYYGNQYPGIISGNCAVIYGGMVYANAKNVSLYINGVFYSIGKSIKSITICEDPWYVYGGWLFEAWNTSSCNNGQYKLTVYVDGIEAAWTYVYIKN